MILRVEADDLAATIELENESWTFDMLSTLFRICGDEVIRTAIGLGRHQPDAVEGGEPGATVE